MAHKLTRRQEVALQRIGIVADLFEVVRETAKIYHPDLEAVGLAVDSSIHDSPRHFAVATVRTDRDFPDALVKVAPEMSDLPEDAIEGLLMHEFGHIATIWGLTGEAEEKDYDEAEKQADCAAEEIFGVEIWYDTEDIERALPFGEPEKGWTRPRRKGVR